ncbi:MAG: tetratricopeptide repeat protein, partial [Planctomycetota bacterium]
ARRELVDELLNEGRVEEALEQAELVRDQSNTEASGHVRVGRCLAALGRTEEAKRSYRRTLECDANDEFAFVQLMILASSDQERRGDLESLWKQVCRQPATEVGVELYVLYAKQFLPWNEVLDQLRAICAERPNSSGIRSELVRLLVSNGEHDEAEVEARRGTETYPEDAASWWTLSEVQSFNGSVDGAGDSVERAVNCAPGSISGLCRLASFRRDSGKPLEALELLERAKAQAPLSPDLRTQAAESLLKAGRLDDAERELVQALRISPAYRTAWIRLSELFHPSGRANELESVTQSILRERIDDSAAWILHSWMQDSFDSCREALERAVETTEPSDEAYDLLAELLQNEGRLDDAAEVLRDHRLSARLPVMLADRLATIEAQRSGDERERECLEELLRQQPSYSRAWYLLFLNAQRTDQPELRDRAAQNLTLSSPDVAIGHRMLGDCRTVAEDFGGALRAYQLAFDLNPSDD